MIPYVVIGSGSTGNSVLIGGNVLVDAGLPYKKIEPYMNDVKLVLITHGHFDHLKVSTVRRMAMENPLLRFGCGTWLVKKLADAGVSKTQIDILKPGMLYNYGICSVIPVSLFHDVPCFGFKLHFKSGKVFYATDTGTLSGISARNYDLYLLEANYVDEEIRQRMDEKRARGEYCYEQRSLKYHLSKAQCDDFIVKNAGPMSEFAYLHCHVDRERHEDGTESKPLTEWEQDVAEESDW